MPANAIGSPPPRTFIPTSVGPTASARTAVAARAPATPRLALGIDAQTADWSVTNARGFGRLANIAYESKEGAINLLTRMGATEVKFFDTNGAQGFIAAAGDRIVVGFRGTEPNSVTDWARDLAAGQVDRLGGEVHFGFSRALNQVWPSMLTELQRLSAERPRPIFMTGHSMGAAMTTIAALELVNEGLAPRAVYTYGSPMVGDRSFAQQYDDALGANTFRVVNQTDAVPRILALGYKHVGEERYLNDDGQAQTGTNFFSKFWDRFNRRLEMPIGIGIVDHRMDTYERQLKQLQN